MKFLRFRKLHGGSKAGRFGFEKGTARLSFSINILTRGSKPIPFGTLKHQMDISSTLLPKFNKRLLNTLKFFTEPEKM